MKSGIKSFGNSGLIIKLVLVINKAEIMTNYLFFTTYHLPLTTDHFLRPTPQSTLCPYKAVYIGYSKYPNP